MVDVIVTGVVQAALVLVLVDTVEVVAVHLAAGVLTVHLLEVEVKVADPEVSRPTFKVLVLAEVEIVNAGPGWVETVDTVVGRVDEVTLFAVVLVLHFACRAETPFLN